MKFKQRAVAELAKMFRAHDNAVPDVGMGYSDDHWVDQAMQRLDLPKDQFDSYERTEVLRAMKG